MASGFTNYFFFNIISSSLEAHSGLRNPEFLLRSSSVWGAEPLERHGLSRFIGIIIGEIVQSRIRATGVVIFHLILL